MNISVRAYDRILFQTRVMHLNRVPKKEQELQMLRMKMPCNPKSAVQVCRSITADKGEPDASYQFTVYANLKVRPRSVSELQRRLEYLERKMESISLGDSSASLLSNENYQGQQIKNNFLGPFDSIRKNRARSHSPMFHSLTKDSRKAAKLAKNRQSKIKSMKKPKQKLKQLDKLTSKLKRIKRRKVVADTKSCIAVKRNPTNLREVFMILRQSRKSESRHTGIDRKRQKMIYVLRKKVQDKENDLLERQLLKHRRKLLQNPHLNLQRISMFKKTEPSMTRKSNNGHIRRPLFT